MFKQIIQAFLGRPNPESILKQIETLLITEVPLSVKAARVKEPMYCLRIWYNGTDSSSDAAPYGMLIKESARKAHIAKEYWHPGDLWMADEWTYPEKSKDIHVANPQLGQLYQTWYQCLCANEAERLPLFRQMTQRVSRKLNLINWQSLLPVTDDFVVFPADGSHNYMDDVGDLLASISPAQEKLLRSRNLIPTRDN